jgi:hypothetical protein
MDMSSLRSAWEGSMIRDVEKCKGKGRVGDCGLLIADCGLIRRLRAHPSGLPSAVCLAPLGCGYDLGEGGNK